MKNFPFGSTVLVLLGGALLWRGQHEGFGFFLVILGAIGYAVTWVQETQD